MIYLITGANGAGKSLYAVSLIDKILADNANPAALPYDEWIKQYETDEDDYLQPIVDDPAPLIRSIFSNIPGLNFGSEHVYSLPKDGLYDWRDKSKFPWGSVFFDDECHRRIPGTGTPGRHPDDIVNQLDMHRHHGHDFYFITQYPAKLHHVVRNLVSSHYHLQNVAGSANATLFTFSHAELNVNDYGARKSASKELFRYPKRLFNYYKSSSLHTKRLRIPKQVVFLGVLLMAIASWLAYLVVSNYILPSGAAEVQEIPLPIPASRPAASPAGHGLVPPVGRAVIYSGCISNRHSCTCYDSDYYPVDMPFAECLNMIEEPLPVRPVIASTSSGRKQPSAD